MATINELRPPYRVGYFVGSLSSVSINRRLSKALLRLAPDELVFTEIAIGNLPLYNRDLDGDFPQVARDYKASIAAQEALLFVTPEYNRSIPGALKNAIDWASRPHGENVIARKATAVIGASTGAIGTAVAQQQLRSVLSFLQAPQMNAPEAYIQLRPGLIDDEGVVTDESTEAFLRGFMVSFFEYIERVLTVVPPPR
ncbi:NADPH-dependent FMN reductase [uncultured Leifsonia sp.]|uniref:NADPH-dependent FMN reductase n=1 Tax=uncultured Leifsonia sp. TaxID=340359 RepID=UPI0025DC7CAE|nr:NADPH-dependent FMN reductase [uncultured Leifsonia sp.]